MKLFNPTIDLPLWFCPLIFKEDYAKIKIWAKCELQLEVLFNPRPHQKSRPNGSLHVEYDSCGKIYVGCQKLRETKVLQRVKHDKTKD
jgi:hypothetical protein